MMRSQRQLWPRGETVAEQTSTVSESALETPWKRRSYLGARSNYESTVFATLRIRYEFRGRNSFKGRESCNTPNYILTVLYHILGIIKVNVYFFRIKTCEKKKAKPGIRTRTKGKLVNYHLKTQGSLMRMSRGQGIKSLKMKYK